MDGIVSCALMAIIEARTDLVRGLLQSVYVIESARGGVQRKWGGDFDRDADRTHKRAERLGRLLDERGLRRPEEVVGPHTDWFESMCGSHPREVPLGAAVLHNCGKWGEVMCEPYLDDITEFIELGLDHTRVDLDLLPWTDDEAFMPQAELPSGPRFVILTDVHIGSRGRADLARRAVADLNEIAPEFVVVPGDFTEDGEPEQFQQAKEIFDQLACPYYAVLKVGDGSVTQLEIPALKDFPFAYSVVGMNDGGVQVVVRQVSDRELVWKFVEILPPLIRRFALGPLSDTSYTFKR